MRKILLAAVLVAGSTDSSAAQTAGSREAYNTMRDIRTSQLIAEANANLNWSKSKKITLLDKRSMPTGARASKPLTELKQNEPAIIERYPLKVFSVVSKSEMILKNADLEKVWLRNYPTDGFAHDDLVQVVGYVKMTGTKTYQTALGSQRTLKAIELLPPEFNHKMEQAARDKLADQSRQRELEAHPEWHLKNGATFRARFDRYAGGSVQLIAIDSQELLRHRLSEFTTTDADRLRELIKNSPKR